MIKDKEKFKRIVNSVLDDIAGVFPYFFGFYIIAFVLSIFSESWKFYFYWPAFHISIIVLGLLTMFSERVKNSVAVKRAAATKPPKLIEARVPKSGIAVAIFFDILKKINVITPERLKKIEQIKDTIINIIVSGFRFSFGAIKLWAIALGNYLRRTTKIERIKIAVISMVLIYFIYQKMSAVGLLILFYGLYAVIFGAKSNISAIAAIFLLLLCQIFLFIKKDASAELLAIYAYYILIIWVSIQIRAYWSGKNI